MGNLILLSSMREVTTAFGAYLFFLPSPPSCYKEPLLTGCKFYVQKTCLHKVIFFFKKQIPCTGSKIVTKSFMLELQSSQNVAKNRGVTWKYFSCDAMFTWWSGQHHPLAIFHRIPATCSCHLAPSFDRNKVNDSFPLSKKV